ncbi:MAG: hypothetical protein C5B45_05845 [Chlamydiae bacterium]|nr:MAG: hypothetical protein C5B45_05845 [Chlamydiota bacterium]
MRVKCQKKIKNLSAKNEGIGLFSNREYATTLTELKKQIQKCQLRAITAANKKLVRLYWTVGKTIVERQESSGWAANLLINWPRTYRMSFPD